MPAHLSRSIYADMFGPTTGDRVRLTPEGEQLLERHLQDQTS